MRPGMISRELVVHATHAPRDRIPATATTSRPPHSRLVRHPSALAPPGRPPDQPGDTAATLLPLMPLAPAATCSPASPMLSPNSYTTTHPPTSSPPNRQRDRGPGPGGVAGVVPDLCDPHR